MDDGKPDLTGHVYILTSPMTPYVKIGGTDYAPLKRIREINAAEPYKRLGPWSLADFRQVSDWRSVEASLHYAFRSRLVEDIEGQKELFQVPLQEASKQLSEIDPALVLRKPKVDRMFQDEDFSAYILRLFRFADLMHWLDIQGAWTFVLFPSTMGGRYFTLNIGPHEVAFSRLAKRGADPIHMLLVDRLVLDSEDVQRWMKERRGEIAEDAYDRALPRATSVFFRGSFEIAMEFLALEGVRRALIAYWSEALIGLRERNVTSVFARHHNWNAVAEIRTRLAVSQGPEAARVSRRGSLHGGSDIR
jgi:hypothetical protein